MEHQYENKLMKRVQICNFLLYETALFLDTHPDNKEAKEYFKKVLEMKKKATEQYTEACGPLTFEDAANDEGWSWIDKPWPWQRKGD